MKKTCLVLISFFSIGLVSLFSAPSVNAVVTGDPACVRAGCSGELCVPFGQSRSTTCAIQPEFACYQQATCEMNPTGQCAFTITPEVQTCLDAINPSPSPSPTVLVGDLNKDGVVNLLDYSIMINELFSTKPNLPSDINGDSKVNLIDYSILVNSLSI